MKTKRWTAIGICAASFACADAPDPQQKNVNNPPEVVLGQIVGRATAAGIQLVTVDRASELGMDASGLLSELEVVRDGRPGTNPRGTVEIRNAGPVASNDVEACLGFPISYCAPVAVQNFYNQRIGKLAVQVVRLAPATGRAALNSDPFPPHVAAELGNVPGSSLGFWRYDLEGALDPGEAAVRTWVFDNAASGDFVFYARIIGEVTTPSCPDADLGSALGEGVFQASTTGSSDDADPDCGYSVGAPDYQVAWTAPFAGNFVVDTRGSDYDTMLMVKAGSCEGPTVGCNDDFQARTSRVAFSAEAGQIFTFHVDGFDSQSGTVTLNVQPTLCGNGTLDEGEACDDGNLNNFDGCDALCLVEPICGNGALEGFEQCDDGNTDPGDGCDQFCLIEPVCGNSVVEGFEQCDDGNTDPGDGCDPFCAFEAVCGNGTLEGFESCDDGNIDSGDGCSELCSFEFGLCARPEPVTRLGPVLGSISPFDQQTGSCGGALGAETVFSFGVSAGFRMCLTAETSDFTPSIWLRENVCSDPAAELACALNPAAVQLDAVPETTYFVGVEAVEPEASGVFELAVLAGDCVPRGPEVCDDNGDNDRDGALDCFDTDCAGDPACPAGSCETPTVFTQIGPVSGTTTQSLLGGSCGGSTGPEHVFAFSVADPFPICIRTESSAFDPVIYVRTNLCSDEGSELLCNDNALGQEAQVDIDAQPGTTYFVIVDSAGESGGDFTVVLDVGPCAPPN